MKLSYGLKIVLGFLFIQYGSLNLYFIHLCSEMYFIILEIMPLVKILYCAYRTLM